MKYLVVFCLVWQLSQCSQQYPEYIRKLRCHVSNPNYEDCMLQKFRTILPYYVKGVPELGIPPLDPLRRPSFSLSKTVPGLADFDLDATNVVVLGVKNTIINSVKVGAVRKYGEVSVTFPWLDFDMDFHLKGKALYIPLDLKGHFHGNFTNIRCLFKSSFDTYKKDGVEYFKMGKIVPKISIETAYISASTTNKDLKSTVQTVVDSFNESPREILTALNPYILDEAIKLIRKTGDAYFATLPSSELVPE